ncbi:GIY-YIG nuclease family protein [Ferrovum myxofaciens]|uniref:Putative integron gene cassette protein n=1 Tax=mine drainage metagenome TaxID=410659 RepID=A0A3P3ZM36_9ZZZZ|nr:GIY-YIG nuclease family protein [Ferrovum myxofaciens]
MIKSYGLHWHIDRVDWGKPNKSGTLEGAASRTRRANPVDFREQRGIYVLYADYELVYIGQAGAGNDRLFKRLKAHKSDHLSERWNRFSWFGTQRVTKEGTISVDTLNVKTSTEVTLNILEAVSIAIAEPRLNLQRGHFGDATQYFQWYEQNDNDEEDD